MAIDRADVPLLRFFEARYTHFPCHRAAYTEFARVRSPRPRWRLLRRLRCGYRCYGRCTTERTRRIRAWTLLDLKPG